MVQYLLLVSNVLAVGDKYGVRVVCFLCGEGDGEILQEVKGLFRGVWCDTEKQDTWRYLLIYWLFRKAQRNNA